MFQHACIQGVGIWPPHHAMFSACGGSFTAAGCSGVFVQAVPHSLTAASSLQQVWSQFLPSFCPLLLVLCHSRLCPNLPSATFVLRVGRLQGINYSKQSVSCFAHAACCPHTFVAPRLCCGAGQTNLLDWVDHLSREATAGLTLKHSFISSDGENLSKAVSLCQDGLKCPADQSCKRQTVDIEENKACWPISFWFA